MPDTMQFRPSASEPDASEAPVKTTMFGLSVALVGLGLVLTLIATFWLWDLVPQPVSLLHRWELLLVSAFAAFNVVAGSACVVHNVVLRYRARPLLPHRTKQTLQRTLPLTLLTSLLATPVALVEIFA